MPLWTDPITADTDWSAQAFISMFWNAVNEKKLAIDPSSPLFQVPAVGADVQYGGTVAPVSTTDKFSVWVLQNWLESNVSGFLATRKQDGSAVDPDALQGTTPAFGPGGPIPPARQIGLMPWTWQVGYANTQSLVSLPDKILGGHTWTRKYPREHLNAAAVAYTDGSAFANGHRSRRQSDGLVYDRTAGAWVLSPNPLDDAEDILTAYGKQAPGDLIGPWLFNELRDVIKALVWMDPFSWWTYGNHGEFNYRDGNGGPSAGPWANVKADAETDFNAALSLQSLPNTPPTAMSFGQRTTGSPPFTAGIVRAYQYADLALGSVRPFTGRLMVWAIPNIPGTSGIITFDSNGDFDGSYGPNKWLLYSDTNTTGGNHTFTLGNTALPVPNWGAEPAAGTQFRQGYELGGPFGMWRFDVPGGFVYY